MSDTEETGVISVSASASSSNSGDATEAGEEHSDSDPDGRRVSFFRRARGEPGSCSGSGSSAITFPSAPSISKTSPTCLPFARHRTLVVGLLSAVAPTVVLKSQLSILRCTDAIPDRRMRSWRWVSGGNVDRIVGMRYDFFFAARKKGIWRRACAFGLHDRLAVFR